MIWFIIYIFGFLCSCGFVCGTYNGAGLTPQTAGNKEFKVLILFSIFWLIAIPVCLCFYIGSYLERKLGDG